MNSTSPMPCARPYDSVGSGSDAADDVLAEFVERLPAAERRTISRVEGAVALLSAALKAARRNNEVGGSNKLVHLVNGETREPTERQIRLAGEIVYAGERAFLPREFVLEAVDDLIFREGDVDAVNDAMFSSTPCEGQLDLFLRGYRV